ncbi:MAG TPA: hypothetical protein VEU72_07455 [Nitrosopumilaceae archaeon]|nr:hypothetical protein [Nitrosopumilaceae archaeon]
MSSQLFQWEFNIPSLIDENVKIDKKIWLKKGEIFLKKDGKVLDVFILGNANDRRNEQKIFPFVKISTLLTNNAPKLSGGGGGSIKSKKEFGKKKVGLLIGGISHTYPKQAIKRIQKYAPTFLKQIKFLHEKYTSINEENEFLKMSLDYFYDSEIKFVYTNEGFISATMSLEALFNDGESDIKYKLVQRTSFLLGLSGLNPVSVYEDLNKLYKYRSQLVHGARITTNIQEKYKLSRYAKKSIIIMHILLKNPQRKQIRKDERKQKILREIDYAMLVPATRKKMKREIIRGLKDFEWKVPRTFKGRGEFGDYQVTAW